jgi:GDP-4-dehydro-6-deoxy-D-mannose reductase
MASEQRILVTGASGFVGRHLLRAIAESRPDWAVTGWYLGEEPKSPPNVRWTAVDLQSPAAVSACVSDAAPTQVVHLAAAADVGGSFTNAHQTWSINVMGTLNLLEATLKHAPDANLLLVSSSEVYGDSFNAGVPLDESAPLSPQNPYAASKAAAELLARTYIKRGLKLAIARPFNHIGPGQSEHFAVSAFARQLARIEAGLQAPELRVGNLDAQRDFTDVRDIVRGYIALASTSEQWEPGLTVNLCSGTSRRIGDVLEELIELSGIAVKIVPDPARLRPADIPLAAGTADTARKLVGWQPVIPWRDTLRSVIADWRIRAKL